ncbi:MAG: glycine zipper domain-containing protein [Sedimentisphaerales bacterium]|jgi:outer membrane lipoprotein SlyB|nr:glycine zipper domain-containing protein [Sedimentisphaerales bacterium]
MWRKYLIISVVTIGFSVALIAGCQSSAQTGALIGTAAGAGAGQAISRNPTGTLVGAAVGAGAGYVVGNELDKKKTRSEIEAIQSEQNNVTVWITISNGAKLPVTLKKSGPNYIGPKGEVYPSLPTEDQLRPIYGF